ncbi:MAG: hypothetical protein ISQ06_04475 [Planctomycetaceae bacterium]|nr:hypothetical protein [Planctomycetaceae bacterium]
MRRIIQGLTVYDDRPRHCLIPLPILNDPSWAGNPDWRLDQRRLSRQTDYALEIVPGWLATEARSPRHKASLRKQLHYFARRYFASG